MRTRTTRQSEISNDKPVTGVGMAVEEKPALLGSYTVPPITSGIIAAVIRERDRGIWMTD